MELKLFWVKYLYIEGKYNDMYWHFNKILPGKWEESEWPRDKNFCPLHEKFKSDHKRVWCESEKDLYEKLFEYEHKRQKVKCFIWILRYVELPVKNCIISATLFQVHYEIIWYLKITGIYKKDKNSYLYGMKNKIHQAGHVGYNDMEVVVFNKDELPAESDITAALLNKLPPPPRYTKIEIKKALRHDPV